MDARLVAAAARLDALPDGGTEADLDREVARVTRERRHLAAFLGDCGQVSCEVCRGDGHRPGCDRMHTDVCAPTRWVVR